MDARPVAADAGDTGSPGLDSGSAGRDGLTGGQGPEVADSLAGLREKLSSSSFEIRGDYYGNPDAGECVAGFISAFVIRFPAGANTVTVDPLSQIASAPMTGGLADSSGSVLRYPVTGSMDEEGELLIWSEGESLVAQITMSGPRRESTCLRASLLRAPL